MSLQTIETQTKKFADAHQALVEEAAILNQMIEAIKRSHAPKIRAAVNAVISERNRLKAMVEMEPELFVEPRTFIFHDVKVGFQKGKGGIEFDDADKVVGRIEKAFGNDAAIYLRLNITPNVAMLGTLPAAELKKLGCEIVNASDQVVIKPAKTAVDKTVETLMKEAA